jgi:hypothetical protein
MKKPVLLACLSILLAGAAVCSTSGYSNSTFKTCSIRIDNQAFDHFVSDVPKGMLLDMARDRLRSGKSLYARPASSSRIFPVAFPPFFKARHSMSYSVDKAAREIITGTIDIPVSGNSAIVFPPGWEFHPDSKSRRGIAILQKKGRKTLVLIDRNRGVFLSITQQDA